MVYDVVTIGNALIDALLTLHDADKKIHFNASSNDLTIRSGEKYLIENCTFAIGGGASRVAIGLTRLGYSTAICAETGNDHLSEMVKTSLKDAGVHTGHLVTSSNQSSFTVGINFKGERTLFTHHVPYKHEFDLSSLTTKWMYLGSLGREWKSVYQDVVEYVKTHDTHLAFNPGASQFKEGKTTFLHVLPVTDVLIVNKEEGQVIAELSESATIRDVLKKLHTMGPKTVVVTDGKEGAYCISQSGTMYSIGVYPCEIVEKTGAGDAFAAGFLGGILAEQPIQTALTWGTLNSASTIGKIGGELGLLTKDKLLHTGSLPDIPQVKEISEV